MPWLDEAIAVLSRQPCHGYRPGGPAAAEPTALAAMALWGHGQEATARSALAWLAGIQSSDGSVGVSAALDHPCWPTGWALLAWSVAAKETDRDSSRPDYSPKRERGIGSQSPSLARRASVAHPVWESQDFRSLQDFGSLPGKPSAWNLMIQRATGWILSHKGKPVPQSTALGHDTSLEAWPWVEGTHSWVEPTAINLLALKACGYAKSDRSREAVRLLCDRAIPAGGWNYGNRVVFGTPLRPHLQPTGLALWALAGEPSAAREVAAATAYLCAGLSARVATASLCYALIGLAAQGQEPQGAATWLESAARRTLQQGAAPYQLALLALAAMGRRGPWCSFPKDTA